MTAFLLAAGVGSRLRPITDTTPIFDVIVDLRPASPTYHNWESFELRDDEQVTLYVPAGCAHGFQALTHPADVSYQIDRVYDPSEDVSIAFGDPELAIPWPLPSP